MKELDLTKKSPPPNQCSANPGFGNPIYPLTGTKKEPVELGLGVGWQPLSLIYDSSRRAPLAVAGTDLADTELPSFGELWLSSLHRRLVVDSLGKVARAARGDGHIVSFNGNGAGVFTADADTQDRLLSVSGGYRYLDMAAQTQESYNTAGQLTRIDRSDGQVLTFTYSDGSTATSIAPGAGYLLSVQDSFGRNVQFQYSSAGRVSQITDPAGRSLTPAYDSNGNLFSLTWPDSSVRQFLYENTTYLWALTGVIDEKASRYSTFGWDSAGRAVSTQHAGGVDAFSVTYAQPPLVVVSDSYDAPNNVVWRTRSWQIPSAPAVALPSGASTTLGASGLLGMPRLTTSSQVAGSGCAASTSTQAYDVNGNIASRDDFNGVRACLGYDLSRNLETSRIEGLAITQACSTLTASATAVIPTGSRKVSTVWHPDWRLPTKVAEPRKLTTSVYNGQPDPFSGNTVASCALGTALLPDGKPIAVLCKQVEQATTDTDGHLGTSATVDTNVVNRVRSWTYNANGQVLTAKGPRTDVNDTTTYTYHGDTTAIHTKGDLQTATNAVGKVTTFNAYNPHGQLLQSTDPNGVVTVNTYDLRQHLLSTSVGGQATSYTYDPVGQLTRVTQPDTSWIGYEYDAAHRQTAVLDNLGNRIEYTLDNAGNRTAEVVKDPAGVMRRQLARSIDALGRVQQTTGR